MDDSLFSSSIADANEESDVQIRQLLQAAHSARRNAYCPYSEFRVGAAVLCGDGTIITGSNVENVSYGLSMCAERLAVMSAVMQGHRHFNAVAVSCDNKGFDGPCGACRQVLAEFGINWDVYLLSPDKKFLKVKLTELLPMAFTPQSLQKERVNN